LHSLTAYCWPPPAPLKTPMKTLLPPLHRLYRRKPRARRPLHSCWLGLPGPEPTPCILVPAWCTNWRKRSKLRQCDEPCQNELVHILVSPNGAIGSRWWHRRRRCGCFADVCAALSTNSTIAPPPCRHRTLGISASPCRDR
jgi:hypothetical protein